MADPLTDTGLVEALARAIHEGAENPFAIYDGPDGMKPLRMEQAQCCLPIIKAHEAETIERAAKWRSMETAPKTGDDLRAKPFLGWCLDDSAPDGGDIRVCWWEPRMGDGKGRWYGDRDLPEKPILWQPLPEPPAIRNPTKEQQT